MGGASVTTKKQGPAVAPRRGAKKLKYVEGTSYPTLIASFPICEVQIKGSELLRHGIIASSALEAAPETVPRLWSFFRTLRKYTY